MAEGVGADVLGQSDGVGQYFDDVENHDAGDVPSFPADEDKVLVAAFDVHRVSVDEIKLQLADGTWGDGYKALFVPLAFYFDEAFFQIEVGELQIAEFGYSESATV